MAAARLPEEVWLIVFEFLSPADKLNVRSSCKLFKRLIDRPTMWKSSSAVCLEKVSRYKPHFWRTLRKRKTSSVVMLKACGAKEWAELSSRLPWLVSLTIHLCSDPTALQTLAGFRELRRLEIRQCRCPSLSDSLSTLLQLTDLSVCEVINAQGSDIFTALSQLTNLTSLSYHESHKKIPLQNLLRRLPNLQRLSLKMGEEQGPLPNDYFCFSGLTSLELLDYTDPTLSPVALRALPFLTSLTVQYRYGVPHSGLCHIRTWLSTLEHLSELSVSQGYSLGAYAASVPGTVRSLSLKGVVGDLTAVRKLAQQLPDLSCLHLDLCSREGHSFIAEVPLLFPKLQSLEMRLHRVPEREFLQLAQMMHLKRLVVLDPCVGPSSSLTDLTLKLHLQTNYRIHVIHSPKPKAQNTCFCVHH